MSQPTGTQSHSFQRLALVTLLFLPLVFIISGCCRGSLERDVRRPRYVSVGSIRADLLSEQQEIVRTLETRGIQVDFWGTRMHSILVPKGKEELAITILRTNRLVLENKVLLSTPTEVP